MCDRVSTEDWPGGWRERVVSKVDDREMALKEYFRCQTAISSSLSEKINEAARAIKRDEDQ